jgi:hypothetical protein
MHKEAVIKFFNRYRVVYGTAPFLYRAAWWMGFSPTPPILFGRFRSSVCWGFHNGFIGLIFVRGLSSLLHTGREEMMNSLGITILEGLIYTAIAVLLAYAAYPSMRQELRESISEEGTS